ncbi:hypothetical protein [Mycobacterium angelicum]|uniref:PE domain-containing protein n=1 Tax=Mycobacterium angelicum TaxID=470074 RepID=A0A1W9ZXU9_MYCAN|nr:hypothetical protein [Mycobacterium angelicum]MCV7198471.1 hypothetical protein [Mycobacterium angelicum]ORA22438.1 hypothetical protein BST12_09780 [Mycobacterium angelicum]
MQSGQLRVDIHQLRATANQWRQSSARLDIAAPPLPRQPRQPTAAAVSSVHAAVDLAAGALTIRTQATSSAVDAGAAGYTNNETTAAAAIAAVRSRRV